MPENFRETEKVEAELPKDIVIAFQKYIWLLNISMDEAVKQAILNYLPKLSEQVDLVKKGKELNSIF
jgi:hypothetical protein